MALERFTKQQKQIAVLNLCGGCPHREIARHLQYLYPGLKPDDMTQKEYEDTAIRRFKEYISNPSMAAYHEIKKGRETRRITAMRWVSNELCDLAFSPLLKMVDFHQAHELMALVSKICEIVYSKGADEVEDEVAEADDLPKEVFLDWSPDPEWDKILADRAKRRAAEAVNPHPLNIEAEANPISPI